MLRSNKGAVPSPKPLKFEFWLLGVQVFKPEGGKLVVFLLVSFDRNNISCVWYASSRHFVVMSVGS